MRASTAIALIASLLIGLTAAVGARTFGLFRPGGTTPEPRTVLVAGRNLLSGMLMDPQYVMVRPMRAEEEREFLRHPDEFLRPIPQVVGQRVTAKNIEADRPILRSDLEPFDRPDILREQIAPGMRPVNVPLTKDRSSGGLVQRNDWVDVYLTTVVERPDGSETTRSACLARNVRVIVKRNTLYPIFAPMPEDQPIQYTLEANPYRAALIEYAKGKGQIAFETLPSSESEVLETRHKGVLKEASPSTPLVSFADLSEAEVKTETALVESTLRGESSVGDEDLTRIFALKSLTAPAPPIVLQQFVGGKRLDDLVVAALPRDRSTSFGFHAPAPPIVDPRTVAATRKDASQAEKLRGAAKAGQLAAASTPKTKPTASKGGIR